MRRPIIAVMVWLKGDVQGEGKITVGAVYAVQGQMVLPPCTCGQCPLQHGAQLFMLPGEIGVPVNACLFAN